MRAAVVLVVVAGVCALWVERRHHFNLEFVEVAFTFKGDRIVGTLAKPPSRNSDRNGLIVFIHGDGPINADHDGGYLPIWESFARGGYASLALDSPGVGRSEGNWLDHSMDDRADLTIAAIRAVENRADLDVDRLGLWGASQAGWVLPKVARSHKGVDFIIAVSPAVNWLEQGRFNLLAELEDSGAGDAEIAEAIAYSDRVRGLLYDGGTYAEYRALAERSAPPSQQPPMTADRWGFVYRNFRSDSRDDLAALGSIPVLLQLAGEDRNVDVGETERVWRELLGEDLTVRRYPHADHSMVRADLADGGIRSWITALVAPRDLFAEGFLAEAESFVRSRR